MLATAKSLKIKSTIELLELARLSPVDLTTCAIGNAAYTQISIESTLPKIAEPSPISPFQIGDRTYHKEVSKITSADVREVSDEVPAKEEATEEDKKDKTEDLEDETFETEVPAEVAPEVEAIIEAVVELNFFP